MAAGFKDPLAGINAFAPAFWRLIAEQAPVPRAAQTASSVPLPEGAAETPPPTPPAVAPERKLPPLTHDGLEALRESLPGFADKLQDIPPPETPLYPPFTGVLPPLTNGGLRGLRDPESGSGSLRDIPEGPLAPVHTPFPAEPDVEREVAGGIKKADQLRSTIGRLEAEKGNPGRGRDAAEFDREIARTQKDLENIESGIGNGVARLPGYRRI
jgi:hypothetical protein